MFYSKILFEFIDFSFFSLSVPPQTV